jgi:hypothetical protein
MRPPPRGHSNRRERRPLSSLEGSRTCAGRQGLGAPPAHDLRRDLFKSAGTRDRGAPRASTSADVKRRHDDGHVISAGQACPLSGLRHEHGAAVPAWGLYRLGLSRLRPSFHGGRDPGRSRRHRLRRRILLWRWCRLRRLPRRSGSSARTRQTLRCATRPAPVPWTGSRCRRSGRLLAGRASGRRLGQHRA